MGFSGGGVKLELECMGLLTVAASLVDNQLWAARTSVLAACGFDSCSSPALEHRLNSMWDLPRSGIELLPPALIVDSLPLSHQGNPREAFPNHFSGGHKQSDKTECARAHTHTQSQPPYLLLDLCHFVYFL